MIEFLIKYENCSIKIAIVNSILITENKFRVIYFNFVLFGVSCDLKRFSVFNPFIAYINKYFKIVKEC